MQLITHGDAAVDHDRSWLRGVPFKVEGELAQILRPADESAIDPVWEQVLDRVAPYSARPAKRVRPMLMIAGYALSRGEVDVPDAVYRYAAALELLHTFLLIHDDVADHAHQRRGGPALHHLLGGARGADKAIVVGDHLFARSIEVMLESDLASRAAATRYLLSVCRHTAIGQYLDLELEEMPLSRVTLFHTLKVAHLKTARYGFSGPLVVGAMLGDASPALLQILERIGRHVGLAFQLRDDLLGLFGDDAAAGKSGCADYLQAKRTFPLAAAFARADESARHELGSLWAASEKSEEGLRRARELIVNAGGVQATERLIGRATRAGIKALSYLPDAGGTRGELEQLLRGLERRRA